jgi:excisionase family DNA binding protein
MKEQEQILTAKEAAEYLGIDVGKLYLWRSMYGMNTIKVNDILYFIKEDLTGYLEPNREATMELRWREKMEEKRKYHRLHEKSKPANENQRILYSEISEQIRELKELVLQLLRKPLCNSVGDDKLLTEDNDKLLTVDAAAGFLGVEKQTVYIWNSKKILPSMKVGRKLFFSKYELTEFIKSHRRKTIAELEAETKAITEK